MANRERDTRGRFSGDRDRKYSKGRCKKRPRVFEKFNEEENAQKRSRTSTSAKKMRDRASSPHCGIKNRIIDISILFPNLEEVLCCKNCRGAVNIKESSLQGLGFKIDIICNRCGQVASINSSKKIGPKNNAWEVNRRSVLAMRALGHGHTGLSTFCGIMDLPPPVAHSAFDNINKQLGSVCEEAAEESMATAVKEEAELTPANQGLTVSGDGSWRKRGFSSLQGVTSIIGNRSGKVLDVAIKNSFCKACANWETKKSAEKKTEASTKEARTFRRRVREQQQ